MKNKLYFFLLTALMGLFGMNASAQDYEISSAEDLLAFADAVNGGETSANAVLTTDIDMSDLLQMETWTPIGNSDKKYEGTFDGQGYAITGFEYTAKDDKGNGLFGYVRNATIKNFSISGELTSDGFTYNGTIGAAEANTVISGIRSSLNITLANKKAHSGGILGSTVTSGNPVLVENCEYSGTMTHSGAGDCQAGILGYTYNGGVKNCLFSGTIIGENNKYGGILGYCKITDFLGVQNCLSIGKIVASEGCTTAAAIIANWNSTANTANVKNNYYCLAEGSTTTIAIGNKAQYCEAPVAVTAEQLASGEVCYLLNGDQSNIAFYQTLNDDEAPVLDSTHGTVYLAGRSHCDGTPYEGVSGYSNTASVVDDHDFVDGFCTVCSTLDETYMTPNGEDYYEIGTPKQFVWFAAYANQKNAAANAILTKDIDLTDVTWIPIGNDVTKYIGTFDGQGKTITGFELTASSTSGAGLFGQVEGGAVIKNFTIYGTITSTGQRMGVIGAAGGSGTVTISGIHSYLDITATQTRHGGVLGAQTAVNTVNIDHCTFSGTLTTNNISGNFGGIVGLTQNNKSAYVNITNCLFDGKVNIGTGDAAGGIVGYTNATKVTIKNCLSVGSVTATNPSPFIGQLNASNSKWAGNNYYTTEGEPVGKPGVGVTVTGTTPEKVTAEQLESGEVAYKLGEAWGQIIGTDEAPVLGGDTPVFYVGEAGYATLYDTTTGYEFKGDVEAYVATLNPKYSNLILTKIEKVPAGTPVILKGTYFNKTAADLSAINIANDLQGTAVDTEADDTMYVLAKPAEKEVGFYKATGTIPAGKAYFQSNAGVKAFFFDGDDATGIEETLSNSPLKGENVYNLAGQRMSKMQKGINIVDGKKILK